MSGRRLRCTHETTARFKPMRQIQSKLSHLYPEGLQTLAGRSSERVRERLHTASGQLPFILSRAGQDSQRRSLLGGKGAVKTVADVVELGAPLSQLLGRRLCQCSAEEAGGATHVDLSLSKGVLRLSCEEDEL